MLWRQGVGSVSKSGTITGGLFWIISVWWEASHLAVSLMGSESGASWGTMPEESSNLILIVFFYSDLHFW
jgi:hypothetical protein